MSKEKQFRSNAEMAHHYLLELLADGLEHSTGEIVRYVLEKTGGQGVSGEPLTTSMIHSAIWFHLRQIDAAFMQSRRGYYISPSISRLGSNKDRILDKTLKILTRAEADLHNCFIVNVSKVSLSDEELLELQRVETLALDTLARLRTDMAGGGGNE